MKKFMILTALLLSSLTVNAEQLGTIKTSGLVFKDSVEIHAFNDPYINGVTCYLTLPKRSLSFQDQTDSSISCRRVGKVTGNLKSQKRIFKKSKSWFVKSLFIDRIYDKKRNVLVYVSYTKKLSGDNANNSISVVVL